MNKKKIYVNMTDGLLDNGPVFVKVKRGSALQRKAEKMLRKLSAAAHREKNRGGVHRPL